MFNRLLPKSWYAPSFEGDDAFSSIPRLPAWSFQRVTDGWCLPPPCSSALTSGSQGVPHSVTPWNDEGLPPGISEKASSPVLHMSSYHFTIDLLWKLDLGNSLFILDRKVPIVKLLTIALKTDADLFKGIPVTNVALQSRNVQGFATRDSNILTFQLDADWDTYFEKQTPTDFNALTF